MGRYCRNIFHLYIDETPMDIDYFCLWQLISGVIDTWFEGQLLDRYKRHDLVDKESMRWFKISLKAHPLREFLLV